MRPDPGNAGAILTSPQSWNGYDYVGGNPMNAVDPSGMASCTASNNYCGGLFVPVHSAPGAAAWTDPRFNGFDAQYNSLGLLQAASSPTKIFVSVDDNYANGDNPNFGMVAFTPYYGNADLSAFTFSVTATGHPWVGTIGAKVPKTLNSAYPRLTSSQCQAIRTVLVREAFYGTPTAARMSGNTWGDHTLEPLNSSYVPNIQTPVGELDVDWYTDLQSSYGFGAGLYPIAKVGWSAIRKFNGQQIGYVWPFQDPGELTAYMESMDGGYGDIFTPSYMAQVCPTR